MTWTSNHRPPRKFSPSSLAFRLNSIEERSQVGLKRLFSGRLSIRREPVFEVLDSDLVLDLRLSDRDCNRRILMDPVHPFLPTKNVQPATYSFIKTSRRDFDGIFCAVPVETGYPASSKRHAGILAVRFYFARAE